MKAAPTVYDALTAAAHGHPVIPSDERTGKPIKGLTIKDASTDPITIKEWWDTHPTAGIALLPKKPAITADTFVWRDPATIPQRQWLYGRHYIRQFISATVAPGGVGKSSLAIVEALAMVTGRNLLGVQSSCPLRVWYWGGEDPLEETERRIHAACLHFGIGAEDIGGRLFINSGRTTEIVIGASSRNGSAIATPVRDALIRTISEKEIDAWIIDPFVSSHRVPENDNMAIDAVAKAWAHIADETDSAGELIHHVRKTGGSEVTVEDGRGAVALLNAARSARVLNVMSKEEGIKFGVAQPRSYFRVENGKANMMRPSETADWFHLRSVLLGNGCGGLVDDSDEVGVVTTWKLPNPLDGMTSAKVEAAFRRIRAGKWREHATAANWVGVAIADALDMDLTDATAKAKVKGIVRVWIAAGNLRVIDGLDEKRMPRKFVEVTEEGE